MEQDTCSVDWKSRDYTFLSMYMYISVHVHLALFTMQAFSTEIRIVEHL